MNGIFFAILTAFLVMANGFPGYDFKMDANSVSGQLKKINVHCAASGVIPGLCRWVGTSPFCIYNECDKGEIPCHEDNCGDGHCCLLRKKTLCCKWPPIVKK